MTVQALSVFHAIREQVQAAEASVAEGQGKSLIVSHAAPLGVCVVDSIAARGGLLVFRGVLESGRRCALVVSHQHVNLCIEVAPVRDGHGRPVGSGPITFEVDAPEAAAAEPEGVTRAQ